jgi:hypothetical protein
MIARLQPLPPDPTTTAAATARTRHGAISTATKANRSRGARPCAPLRLRGCRWRRVLVHPPLGRSLPQRIGLAGAFDRIVTGSDVEARQARPRDLPACGRSELGLDPGACLAIEDAPAGIASAQGRGNDLLGRPDGVHPRPALPDPHREFESLARSTSGTSSGWPHEPRPARRRDGIATLTLNRPEALNALSPAYLRRTSRPLSTRCHGNRRRPIGVRRPPWRRPLVLRRQRHQGHPGRRSRSVPALSRPRPSTPSRPCPSRSSPGARPLLHRRARTRAWLRPHHRRESRASPIRTAAGR